MARAKTGSAFGSVNYIWRGHFPRTHCSREETTVNLPPPSREVQVTVRFQPATQPVNFSWEVISGNGLSSTDLSLIASASSLGEKTLLPARASGTNSLRRWSFFRIRKGGEIWLSNVIILNGRSVVTKKQGKRPLFAEGSSGGTGGSAGIRVLPYMTRLSILPRVYRGGRRSAGCHWILCGVTTCWASSPQSSPPVEEREKKCAGTVKVNRLHYTS